MKTYKVGIIGIGRISLVHIEALRQLENVDVVSISSRHQAEEKSKRLGVKSYYTDYKEMIDKETLDAVHICTSNDVHYEIASYALNHNLHVILEKPMTMNVDEAIKLYHLAKSKGLVAKIHFHNRFYANNQFVKTHIKDIGPIISIHGEYTQGWAASPDVYNWRDNQKYGGLTRVIADVGTHYFDLVEFLSGHKITEVSALFKQVHPKRGGNVVDTEDIGVVIYKTDKNAIGSAIISQSLIGNDNLLSYTLSGLNGSFKSNGDKTSSILYATLNEQFKGIEITQIDTLKNSNLHQAVTFVESFAESFRQFYHEIENKNFASDYANFEDGLHSMQLIEAIYQSQSLNKWVKVSKENK